MALNLAIFGVYDLVVFVLVFALVYAILSRSRFFDKSDIPALIAVGVAIVSMASSFFVAFVVAFLPYVLAILVFLFLMMLLFNTATIPQESIGAYLKKSTLIPVLIVFMMFIFGLIAYGAASAQFGGAQPSSTACIANCGTSTNSSASNSSSSGSSSGVVVNTSFNYITSSYVISILTSPDVMSLLLTLAAMGVAVYFMTREKAA